MHSLAPLRGCHEMRPHLFNAALISSVLSLPAHVTGKLVTLQVMFLSWETIVSAVWLYLRVADPVGIQYPNRPVRATVSCRIAVASAGP